MPLVCNINLTGVEHCPHDDPTSTSQDVVACPTCDLLRTITQLDFAYNNINVHNELASQVSISHIREMIRLPELKELMLPLEITNFRTLPCKIKAIATLNRKSIQVRFSKVPSIDPLWQSHEEKIHILKLWLQNSFDKHVGPIYKQLQHANPENLEDVPLPTRILDLLPTDSSDSDLRLKIPQPDTKGRYMTLSHRWGEYHKLRLTRSTIESFQNRISFKSLPRTYRDAVTLVRRLGFRYLWIDALCIVQDDSDDWLQESQRMSAVYNNSCCTIAAHSAKDDNDGFLFESFYYKPNSTRYSHLNTRGWVFQERALSRRILHFCAAKVFFEDASGICTTDWCSTTDIFKVLHSGYYPLQGPKPDLEDFAISSGWYKIVEAYSSCQLTYETDRIPAIAGLAKYYVQLDMENQFMWGVWSKSLHQGLLWVATSTTPRENLAGYMNTNPPPSWSWARWQGRISYPRRLLNCTPRFEVMKIDTHLEAADQIISSQDLGHSLFLKLNILEMLDVHLHETSVRSRRALDFNEQLTQLFTFDSLEAKRGNTWISLDHQRIGEVHFPQLTLALITENKETERFFWEDEDKPRESVYYLFYFLLLCKVVGEPGKYRRVGLGASQSSLLWWGKQEEVIEII